MSDFGINVTWPAPGSLTKYFLTPPNLQLCLRHRPFWKSPHSSAPSAASCASSLAAPHLVHLNHHNVAAGYLNIFHKVAFPLRPDCTWSWSPCWCVCTRTGRTPSPAAAGSRAPCRSCSRRAAGPRTSYTAEQEVSVIIVICEQSG